MSDEFEDGLRRLAAEAARATGDGSMLVTPDVVRRAQRGRRVHDTVVGGLSALALATVAVTGAAIADREPAPPAETTTPTQEPTPTPEPTPSSTPTSTPTPTQEPLALPVADPTAAPGVCGSVPTVTESAPLAPGIDLTEDAPSAATAGAPLEVAARIWEGDGLEHALLVEAPGTRFVVTAGGVVVATAEPSRQDEALLYFSHLETRGWLDLVVCDDGADTTTPGRPLPAGEYELWAVATVGLVPDAEIDGDMWDGMRAGAAADRATARTVLVSDPKPLTISGTATTAEPAPDAPDTSVDALTGTTEEWPTPACGEPLPAADANGLLTLEVDTTPLVQAAEDTVNLVPYLRWTGPGTGLIYQDNAVAYAVLRDGVVVGGGGPPGDDWAGPMVMQHGTALPPSGMFPEWQVGLCEAGDSDLSGVGLAPGGFGTPLPPGEYEVVAYTVASIHRVTTSSGETVYESTEQLWHRVTGPPVPLVVE